MRLTRPSQRTAAVAAVLALGVAGGTVLAVGLADGEQPAAAPPHVEEAQPTLPPEGVVLPTPSSDVHVAIPALDVDLPVLPLSPRNGSINPRRSPPRTGSIPTATRSAAPSRRTTRSTWPPTRPAPASTASTR